MVQGFVGQAPFAEIPQAVSARRGPEQPVVEGRRVLIYFVELFPFAPSLFLRRGISVLRKLDAAPCGKLLQGFDPGNVIVLFHELYDVSAHTAAEALEDLP